MKLKLPVDVELILDTLHSNGYEAYVVGGCVRDAIMGREPHDWDICTSALPGQIIQTFERYNTIPTGLQHGTITIMLNGVGYEITTYRIDGVYVDHRRPDNVKFTSNLYEDLARRDFTINALAYDPDTGIIDKFNGIADIKNKIIRCVGNPRDRFKEDALRILRAIRFCAQLNFTVDSVTSMNISEFASTLKYISKERIQSEFMKIMAANNASVQLCTYKDVFAEIIPYLSDMFGFDQHNPYHEFDVWDHTLMTIMHAEDIHADKIVKIALLFHDIGKPHCFQDEGIRSRHFYGHGQISANITDEILRDLKFDNITRIKIKELVFYHDAILQVGTKYVKRWLNKLGDEQYLRLLTIQECDVWGQCKQYRKDRIDKLNEIRECYNTVKAKDSCFTLKDLAISGKDLIANGWEPGPAIGKALNLCLNNVIDEVLPNDSDVLMKFITNITY